MYTVWSMIAIRFAAVVEFLMGHVNQTIEESTPLRRYAGAIVGWKGFSLEDSSENYNEKVCHNVQESRHRSNLYYYVMKKNNRRYFLGPYEPDDTNQELVVPSILPENTEVFSKLQAEDCFLDETRMPVAQRTNHKVFLETLIRQKVRDYEENLTLVAKDRRRHEEVNVYWRVVYDDRGVVSHVEFFTTEYFPEKLPVKFWEKPFVLPVNRIAELLAPLGTEEVVYQPPT